MSCMHNVHTWDVAHPSAGRNCECGKIYDPLKPHTELVEITEVGETREFPYGFIFTFNRVGAWQVIAIPGEPALNTKAAFMAQHL